MAQSSDIHAMHALFDVEHPRHPLKPLNRIPLKGTPLSQDAYGTKS